MRKSQCLRISDRWVGGREYGDFESQVTGNVANNKLSAMSYVANGSRMMRTSIGPLDLETWKSLLILTRTVSAQWWR